MGNTVPSRPPDTPGLGIWDPVHQIPVERGEQPLTSSSLQYPGLQIKPLSLEPNRDTALALQQQKAAIVQVTLPALSRRVSAVVRHQVPVVLRQQMRKGGLGTRSPPLLGKEGVLIPAIQARCPSSEPAHSTLLF